MRTCVMHFVLSCPCICGCAQKKNRIDAKGTQIFELRSLNVCVLQALNDLNSNMEKDEDKDEDAQIAKAARTCPPLPDRVGQTTGAS